MTQEEVIRKLEYIVGNGCENVTIKRCDGEEFKLASRKTYLKKRDEKTGQEHRHKESPCSGGS